jgi:DNA-binding MarR family transcriptional regulator
MTSKAILAWLRLARVYQKVDRASVTHLRRWGLSVAQFDVLARVGAREGITQQELAQTLLVTKGNVCQLLDRMEAAGWLVRRPDGRANRLFLTPAGWRLHDEVVPAQEALIERLIGGLTADEQRELGRLLKRLNRTLAPYPTPDAASAKPAQK